MNLPTYCFSNEGKAILCLFCGRLSHNPNDVANLYCVHCHVNHTRVTDPKPFDREFEIMLQQRFPEIPWRTPISVSVEGVTPRLVCRLCIARYGLRGDEVQHWPRSREFFDNHMKLHH